MREPTIHTYNEDPWPAVEDAIKRNWVDILLISPERLVNERFTSSLESKE